MGAGDNADRVNLKHGNLADSVEDVNFAGLSARGFGQTERGQHQTAGLLKGERGCLGHEMNYSGLRAISMIRFIVVFLVKDLILRAGRVDLRVPDSFD